MSIQLTVPVVAQHRPYECWYAAVCMVAYYFFPGPRLGAPVVWEQSKSRGIMPAEFALLAQNEGLKPINMLPNWDAKQLELLLRLHGPIWCAGFWFGPGHVVVLTGADSENVYFNDPNGGMKKAGTINWFNSRLARSVSGCMLYKARITDDGRY